MKIICGLGNPGKEFEGTRHNLGFLILDEFKKKKKFPKFKLSKKFLAKISQKKLNQEKAILAKPQTFMNASGKSVKILIQGYRLKPQDLIVIHDDIDLPLGKIKVNFGRGSGGHRGVQSIINEIKSKDFWRIKIGICPQKKPKNLKKFVLEKFNEKEREILKKAIKESILALEKILKIKKPASPRD